MSATDYRRRIALSACHHVLALIYSMPASEEAALLHEIVNQLANRLARHWPICQVARSAAKTRPKVRTRADG